MATTPSTPASSNTTPPLAAPVGTPKVSGPKDSVYVSNPVDLLKPSWNAVKVNLGSLIGLLLLIIASIIVGTVILFASVALMAKAGGGIAGAFGLLVATIIVVVAMIALAPAFTIALLESAKGQKVAIGHVLRESWKYAFRVFVGGVLTLLAVIGGLILFIIPGLIFGAWFAFTTYIIIDQNVGAVEAMKRSKALVKGHVIETWGLFGMTSVFNILNIIPILGALASAALSIMYLAAPALRYMQLKELTESKAPAPSIHWANYAVIALALVGGSITGAQNAKKAQPEPITTPSIYNTEVPSNSNY
jgi:hypothetical protein